MNINVPVLNIRICKIYKLMTSSTDACEWFRLNTTGSKVKSAPSTVKMLVKSLCMIMQVTRPQQNTS